MVSNTLIIHLFLTIHYKFSDNINQLNKDTILPYVEDIDIV